MTQTPQTSNQTDLNKLPVVADAGYGVSPPASPSPTPAQKKLQEFNANPDLGGPKKLKPEPGSVKATRATPAPTLAVPPPLEGGPDSNQPPLKKVTDKANEEASRVRQTGGLLLAVVILIILVWLLIPTASGLTRLSLLWNTILGRTKIIVPSEATVESPNQVVGGEGPSYDQVNQTGQQLMNGNMSVPDLSLLF